MCVKVVGDQVVEDLGDRTLGGEEVRWPAGCREGDQTALRNIASVKQDGASGESYYYDDNMGSYFFLSVPVVVRLPL